MFENFRRSEIATGRARIVASQVSFRGAARRTPLRVSCVDCGFAFASLRRRRMTDRIP
jgi:hypothetical protein